MLLLLYRFIKRTRLSRFLPNKYVFVFPSFLLRKVFRRVFMQFMMIDCILALLFRFSEGESLDV